MRIPKFLQRDYVLVQGGLGNQLYQLSYAHHLQKVQGRKRVRTCLPLYYQMGDTQNRTKRNVLTELIQGLGLESSRIDLYGFRKAKEFAHQHHFLRPILFKEFTEPLQQHAIYLPKGVFNPLNAGERPALYNLHVGNYQSYKYLDSAFTSKLYSALKVGSSSITPSPEQEDVAIHLRRGDFLLFSETYRCFNAEHYLQGLSILGNEMPIGKVYVFSDDFEAIKDEIATISAQYQVECVKGNSVVGDIVHMAQFSRFVLANSTFSWWAAFMAETERPVRVIVPKEPLCYSNPEDSYFPPHWTTI